ncbi:hypothetical protein IEU95_11820 [Hoyosella rhizosphaerae]|uniref:DUF732 domain-containing protein n=1 Tax=Hoyosella rhizosphaerae TaxID=1755582 RepID=A0A916XCH7_9ACTN|nr:hypothetical protein [Hoyosella rhizosphaerae]MBN4927521.1 hypothetical protein [Hoyosella rhizosphaerae]GGC63842.1 hypothetical protein GCM10011410_15350 [Hoyosella rhizosphaerae]
MAFARRPKTTIFAFAAVGALALSACGDNGNDVQDTMGDGADQVGEWGQDAGDQMGEWGDDLGDQFDDAIGSGSDTTCGEYVALAPEEQRMTILDHLESEGQEAPTEMDVADTMVAVENLCMDEANESTPISEAS